MIPEEPTPEQVQALVEACPMLDLTELPDGYHELRLPTFYERALEALRRTTS